MPIGITVEGANILTRSMIIYGQGAIRCHPFALEEIHAVEAQRSRALRPGLLRPPGASRCATRCASLLLALSGGRFARARAAPARRGGSSSAWTRLTAAFALVSDAAMATLGGALKRREKITGRLADVLAWSYLASAALKRFHDDGAPAADLPIVRFACETCFERAEAALDGILRNLPSRAGGGGAARAHPPVRAPRARTRRRARRRGGARGARRRRGARAADRRDLPAARPTSSASDASRRRCADAQAALPVEAKLRRAVRDGRLAHAPGDDLARAAHLAGLLSDQELALLREADRARDEAIQVDAFSPEEFPRVRD